MIKKQLTLSILIAILFLNHEIETEIPKENKVLSKNPSDIDLKSNTKINKIQTTIDNTKDISANIKNDINRARIIARIGKLLSENL